MSFSILIPTLFRTPNITPLVETFEEHNLVDEIIVLDNTGKIEGYRDGKLTVLQGCRENYVNGSWNILVDYSKSEFYAILNDDILLDPNILYEILDHDWTIPSIIGLGYDTIVTRKGDQDPYIRQLMIDEEMPYGFGQALFGKKSQWPSIPEYLRIWFGDNYLATKLYPHTINNVWWEGAVETTSGNREFDLIKQKDIERWTVMVNRGLI